MIRIVTEFSERKQKIEDQLTYATKQIIDHICKIVLMPESNAINHWKQEIANFLFEVDKIKGNNKYPSEKQIMNWTYNKQEDMLTDATKMKRKLIDVIDDYEIDYAIEFTVAISIINDFCKDYFSWISKELAKYGYVNRRMVYEQLNFLIKKYLED
jgi:hypothetical protein